jgi:hypothetical protein
MDKRILVLGATAVTSAAAGLAAGYQLAKRRLTKEYVEKLEEDMAAYRWSYSELQKLKASKAPTIDEEMAKKGAREALSQMDEVPVETLERVAAGLRRSMAADAMTQYSAGATRGDRVVEATTVTTESLLGLDDGGPFPEERHLFDAGDADDAVEGNLALLREVGKPYIISARQFVSTHPHKTASLTWYDEDGVLADSQDKPVPDVEEVVGEENMERFGVGSDDNSIVYIRNDKLDVAFEVVLDQRSYAQVVMGADPADPRVQKRSKQRQRMSADA